MPKLLRDRRPADWPASRQWPWARPLFRALLFLVADYRVEGTENFPEPPYLGVSNHMSYFDIPAVSLQFPRGVIGFAGRKYKGTWREPLFEMNAAIWVRQFSADREALKAGIHVLKHGAALALAPEGTRSRTGQLIEGTGGAAFIATRTNVPIVPAAVYGTEKVFKQLRPRIQVRIGKPFRLPEGRAKGEQLDAYTERIMCAIAALLPEQYHGVYAGNPLIEEMAEIVC